jgi:hypothetical protein
MKKFIIAALGAALGLASLNASAVTLEAGDVTLQPSLTLESLCSVVVVDTPITAYQSTGAAFDLDVADIGTVTVSGCSADYKIGADGGASYTTVRQLKEPTLTKYIPYTLGITAGAGATATAISTTTNWGTNTMNAAGFPVPVNAPAMVVSDSDLTDVVFTVSATFNIPLAVTAPIGTYADAVTIGVEF